MYQIESLDTLNKYLKTNLFILTLKLPNQQNFDLFILSEVRVLGYVYDMSTHC